jgi:translation initiation factor IF-3
VVAKINDEIGAREVRLIGEEGEQLGIRSAGEARAYAYARDLDLVEVAGSVDPPVCRVMDYGKWRYEEERKARANRKNQLLQRLIADVEEFGHAEGTAIFEGRSMTLVIAPNVPRS